MTATPFPFAYSVNEFTTQPWTFEEDVEHYAELGVDAVEVCEAKLDDRRFAEQLARVKDAGLTISGVQPLARTFFSSQMQPQPQGVDARTARLMQTIERIAPFAPGAAFVVNTGAPTKGNVAEVVDVVTSRLRSLSEFAAAHDVRLALEPLNATQMNTETALWTLRQALDLLDAVDRPNVGLCLDFWNNWQDPDLEGQMRRAGHRIFVLQASDWRTPRSSGDRLVPGDGIIPLGPLLHAVHEVGYRGPCAVEIFSQDVPDSLYHSDLRDVVRRSRQGLKAAWRGAHQPPEVP